MSVWFLKTRKTLLILYLWDPAPESRTQKARIPMTLRGLVGTVSSDGGGGRCRMAIRDPVEEPGVSLDW